MNVKIIAALTAPVAAVVIGAFATRRDKDGFDKNGWDKDGYNKAGYNKDGFDRNGYNAEGRDKEGYDKQGFNSEGRDRKGYDKNGYNREGYNRSGYDKDGYNKDGFDRCGRDKEGYNKEGYNLEGFNRDGYDRQGYDVHGYNGSGFDRALRTEADNIEIIKEKIEKCKNKGKQQMQLGYNTYALLECRKGLERCIVLIIEHKEGTQGYKDSLAEQLNKCKNQCWIDEELAARIDKLRLDCNEAIHENDNISDHIAQKSCSTLEDLIAITYKLVKYHRNKNGLF